METRSGRGDFCFKNILQSHCCKFSEPNRTIFLFFFLCLLFDRKNTQTHTHKKDFEKNVFHARSYQSENVIDLTFYHSGLWPVNKIQSRLNIKRSITIIHLVVFDFPIFYAIICTNIFKVRYNKGYIMMWKRSPSLYWILLNSNVYYTHWFVCYFHLTFFDSMSDNFSKSP